MNTSKTASKTQPNAHAAFDSEEGSPTLTFVIADESLAIPYHTLHHMRFAKDARSIDFAFDEFEVTVEGTNLLPLWRELQGYNVREVRLARGLAERTLESEHADTIIRSISIKVLNNDPEDDTDVAS